MRTIIGLLAFFSLPVCAQKHVVFTDSSLVIITMPQTKAPVSIAFSANYSFPDHVVFAYSGQCSSRKSCQFYLKHKDPVLFHCNTRNKNFTGLLLPSDTLRISIAWINPEQEEISFEGKSALYCRYYLKLAEDAIFQKLNRATRIPDKDILKSFAAIDAASVYYKSFLQEYIHTNSFPVWFVQFEELQIKYDDALQKLKAFSLFNLNHDKKIFLAPQHMVWIADVPVDNPEALQTPAYYDFLHTYFSLLQGGLDNSGISSKVFRHFLQTLPEVRKQLKSEVYDYYLTYSLLGYYKNASVKQSVDSLVVTLKPEFKHATMVQLLLDYKDKKNK